VFGTQFAETYFLEKKLHKRKLSNISYCGGSVYGWSRKGSAGVVVGTLI